MPQDLLHPLPADEKRKHKLKRLVQSPNSFFMDVKCPGCFSITTVFSHAQASTNTFSQKTVKPLTSTRALLRSVHVLDLIEELPALCTWGVGHWAEKGSWWGMRARRASDAHPEEMSAQLIGPGRGAGC